MERATEAIGGLYLFISMILTILLYVHTLRKVRGNRNWNSRIFSITTNLAISDIIFSICMTIAITLIAITKTKIDNITCDILGIIIVSTCLNGNWTIVLIARHRRLLMEKKYIIRSGGSCEPSFVKKFSNMWICSVAISILPLIGWSRYSKGELLCLPNSAETSSYTIMLMTIGYIIPIVTMTIEYSRIIYQIRKRRKDIEAEEECIFDRKLSLSRKRRHKIRELKVAKNLMKLVISFYVYWTPFAVGSVFHSINMYQDLHMLKWSTWFLCSNSLTNSIIYGTLNKKLRACSRRRRTFSTNGTWRVTC